MRIGINALFWGPNQMGGTQTYLTKLVEALVRAFPRDEFVVFLNADGREAFPVRSENLSIVGCPVRWRQTGVRLLWQYLALPRYAKRAQVDVLHSLGYLSPVAPGLPCVVTVLDMIHYRRPKEISNAKRWLWRVLFPISLRSAAAVITISKAVEREVAEEFPWSGSRIRSIHLGVDETVFRVGDRAGGHVDRPTVLGVASMAPHKNLDGLIRAFERARERVRTARLILVGTKTKTGDRLWQEVQERGLEGAIEFAGRISERELVTLYQSASVMVAPSHYEGFCLPVLEAMACGCPVVSADSAVFEEVGGDASVRVDATDVSALAGAIAAVLLDEDLRSALKAKGLRRARAFTWRQTAEETMEVYREVCGAPDA
jgi:glycosyltransferase involved in cell wall biosynthesis